MGNVVDLNAFSRRRRILASANVLKEKTAWLAQLTTWKKAEEEVLRCQRMLAGAAAKLEEGRSFAAECQSAMELGDLNEMARRRDDLARRLNVQLAISGRVRSKDT